MSLDMTLASYPQIYVRIKLTILPGSEPPSLIPIPGSRLCHVIQLCTNCIKTKT